MATNAYQADINEDINLLMGSYIDNLEFTVTDEDGDPFDFSAAVSPFFTVRIYDKRTNERELLVTLTQVSGELSETGGVITWDGAYPTEMTYFGKYDMELDWTDSEGNKRVSQGTIYVK